MNSSNPKTYQAEEAVQDRQNIRVSLEIQEEVSNKLFSAIGDLSARLSFVLRPEFSNTGEKLKRMDDPRSEFSEDIVRITAIANSSLLAVEDLIDRLDL